MQEIVGLLRTHLNMKPGVRHSLALHFAADVQ